MSGNLITLPKQDYPSFLKEDNPENAEVDAILNKIWYMFNNTKMNLEKLKFVRNEILKTNIYVDEFEKFADYWIRTKVKFFTICEFLEWYKIWLRDHPRKGLSACPYDICKSDSIGYLYGHNVTKNLNVQVLCRCHPKSEWKSTDKLSFEQEVGKLGIKINEQN